MARESKWLKLERERGKPAGQILVEELNEAGSIAGAAVNIDITYKYVVEKMDELGIEKNITWRLPEAEHAHS